MQSAFPQDSEKLSFRRATFLIRIPSAPHIENGVNAAIKDAAPTKAPYCPEPKRLAMRMKYTACNSRRTPPPAVIAAVFHATLPPSSGHRLRFMERLICILDSRSRDPD